MSENGVWGSFEKNNFGDEDKWNKIVLWGRCPGSNIGQYGSWVYGDGNKTGWSWITNANYKTLNSDSHQYATNLGKLITFYTAMLLIKAY